MVKDNMKVLRWAIGLLWLISATLPFIPHVGQRGLYELSLFGLNSNWAYLLMYLSMLMDAVCAYLALFVAQSWAWLFQMTVVFSYSVLLTYSHADLWLDPFGALLKNIPILASLFVMLQADKRTVTNR